MDPDIDFVTLLGTAGTGKTLLALAAGLAQTMDAATLSRDHHDPRHGLGRRGHRFPARHRGRKNDAVDGRTHRQSGSAHPHPGRRQLGPRRDQRSARQPHQDPRHELHARTHLPEPLADHRRSAEPHAQADEDPGHPRRSRHQDHLPGQCRTDRHALSHRDQFRPHLRGGPFQGLAAQRAHHPAPRRALAPGRFRLGSVVGAHPVRDRQPPITWAHPIRYGGRVQGALLNEHRLRAGAHPVRDPARSLAPS